MNIYRRNLNYLCRTCLTELDKSTMKYNLHETEFLEQWFTNATSLPLDEEHDLPQFLCTSCYMKLHDFDEFRSMILRSHRILGDMLHLALEIESNNKKRNSVQQPPSVVDASSYEHYEWLELQVADIDETEIKQVELCAEEEEDLQMLSVAEELKANDLIDDVIVEEIFEGNAIVVEEDDLEHKFQQFNEVANLLLDDHIIDDTAETDNQTLDDSQTGNEYEDHNDDDFDEIEYYEKNEADCLSSQERVIVNRRHRKSVKNGSAAPKRGEIKFHCEKCPHRWFLSQENLDAHKRTHEGLRPFACKECQRSFNLSTQLRVHMREDHSDNPKKIDCPYDGCDKWFTKSGSLKTHMRNKHARYTPYICEDCGRIFNNSFAFREHRYKHTSEAEYPFQCEQCDKRFAAKSRYMRHLVRHTGVKSFECPHCDMKKYTRDELNAHLNTHTKEKLWTCKYCPKVFTTSTNWRIHEQTVHKGIRKFNCRYCEQTFGRPHTRKRHEMIHTGERPCVCHVCDKRFIQAATLKAHLKTHVKQEESESLMAVFS